MYGGQTTTKISYSACQIRPKAISLVPVMWMAHCTCRRFRSCSPLLWRSCCSSASAALRAASLSASSICCATRHRVICGQEGGAMLLSAPTSRQRAARLSVSVCLRVSWRKKTARCARRGCGRASFVRFNRKQTDRAQLVLADAFHTCVRVCMHMRACTRGCVCV
jgi:hypothetical protein